MNEVDELETKLVAAKLLNPNTGTQLVRGIEGEDKLLAQWRELVPGIGMYIERLHFDESLCWPSYP